MTDYEDPWGRPPAEESPAPGWWKASDGNWYPPTSQPGGGGGYYSGGPVRSTEGAATGALVCSILSWVVCPVILAVVALVLAAQARRRIAESGGALDGDSQIKAAKWIAWLNIGLFGLLAAFLAVIIVIAAVFGDGGGGGSSEFGLSVLGR
jgi:hypothetical protein